MNFSTVQETCRTCGITPNTYYSIRNRLFYAMQLMMDQVKLYGVIGCDITFARVSYKGLDLTDPDYPEESIFFQEDYKPRESRKRGDRNKLAERASNSVCIFTAIDDRGHCFVRFVGLGSASANRLLDRVGRDKFLLSVPASPDTLSVARSKQQRLSTPGSPSLLVSDKERAIISFAAKYGIPHEHHIYRKNGVQLRLPSGAHDIQSVNQLHSKLKQFLRNTHYVSSKYLPGYLVLFEFLQNTQGSQAAITELFRILSQPGLGKPTSFYNEQYVVPNYLHQWISDENPLKHLKQNQIHAYYLYRTRLDDIQRGAKEPQAVSDIAEICGMSTSNVRRTYKNLESAGYGPHIMRMYKVSNPQRKQRIRKAFSPEILAIYDAYNKHLMLSGSNRMTLAAFLREQSIKTGVEYKYKTMKYYFYEIEKSGLRPK